MKISVLDAATLGSDLDLAPLQTIGEVKIFQNTDASATNAHVADSDVIILNKVKINPKTYTPTKQLRLICVAATGYDNIDLDFCKKNGIAVCNVKGYSTASVVQITLAMALSLASNLKQYTAFVADGSYTQGGVANKLDPPYHELCGKTWGIVGAGNIGSGVACVAQALGCKVLVYKRTPSAEFENADIDTLCREADVISLHTPLSDSTRNLINAKRIGSMKKTAIVINVARGAVADEAALAEAITEGRLGGLGVDVYSKEPFGEDHPYTKIADYNNVCFTPHMAWGAYEARVRCLQEMIENIKAFLKGESRNRLV